MSTDTAAMPLADGVCLCLIDEADDDHPIHGWHLVRLLAPGGDIGRIWSLSRALTYRSVDRLIDRGFVIRDDHGDDRRRHLHPSGGRGLRCVPPPGHSLGWNRLESVKLTGKYCAPL